MDERPDRELEEPMDPEILASPEMQRRIARARELAKQPRPSEGGSTSEDLKRLADEIRRLATPT